MNRHHLVAIGLVTLASTRLASAGFLDVVFEAVPANEVDTPAGYQTWRAVARFSNADDSVLSVGGDLDVAPLVFHTNDPAGLRNLDAGDFGEGMKIEDFPLAPISAAWDSYVTIDWTDAFHDVDYSPGFLGGGPGNVITGTDFVENDGGWYDGNPGQPAIAGADLKVVIAQFTVGQGFDVELSGVINGVHEFASPAPVEFTSEFQATSADDGLCIADIDLDGNVGFGDLLAILSNWGPCFPGAPCVDLDGDGETGFGDLLIVLSNWGPCA